MSQKNLNVSNKTHKFFFNKLNDTKILKLYSKFEKELDLNENFIVAVSGGPDSLALSFLSKIYSLRNSLKISFIIVDHKLRKNSSNEALFLKRLLKKFNLKLNILTWIGNKPKSNIQSVAREKRYQLLIKSAKKLKIKYILLGHQKEDLFENFFLRILRGSGLNGLVSFDKSSKQENINLIRPLLNFSKNELEYIANKVFGIYLKDPSNSNEKFKRVKIRNFINSLQSEGLNLKKFNLTIKNLKFANDSIKFFIEKNLSDNANFNHKKKLAFLNKDFFNQPEEIVFRSLTEVIKIVGTKYYPSRGKKIDKLVGYVLKDSYFKTTLGNCIIEKANNTIIVSKEH